MSEPLDPWLWDLEQPLAPTEWEPEEADKQPKPEEPEAKAESPARD